MTVNVPQLLTITDLMELLTIRKTAAYELVKAKRFPKPIRVGSLRRWPADEVLEWLQGQRW